MKELNKLNIQGLDKQGVYKIFFYKNEKPFPINRILKVDETGLIYIGCTKKQGFEKRLNDFILSMKNQKTINHPGGNKIFKNKSLKDFFSDGKIMFEVFECFNPLDEEFNLIINYISEYGEKPPLNG